MSDAAAPAAPAAPTTTAAAPASSGGAAPAAAKAPAPSTTAAPQKAGTTEAARVNGAPPPKGNAPNPPSGEQRSPEDAAAAEVKAELRRYKLKMGGKEIDATADEIIAELGDGVLDAAQIQRAARLRMRQVAERERELTEAAQDLRDPARALALLDRYLSPQQLRAAMEDRYARFLDEDRVTPEQREARSKETALEQRERKVQEWEQARAKEQRAQQVQQGQRAWGQAFASAATQAGLDGKDPHVIAELARVVESSLDDGEPYTPAEAARIVAEREGSRYTQRLKSTSIDKLYEQLGPEGVEAFRRHDLERARGAQAAAAAAKPPPAPKPRDPSTGQFQSGNAPPRKVPMREYFENLAKKGSR